MSTSFLDDTAIRPSGGGGFSATVTADWSQGRAAFGGLLAGQMLRAAETLIPPLSLRSVMVDFLAPVAPGEVALTATLLRAGRSMSRVEVHLSQASRRCATLLAAYGPPRATALSLPGPAAPDAPEDLTPMPWIEDVIPRFTQRFDYGYSGGRFPFTGQSSPGVGGLVRLREPVPVDAAVILALIDAWPSPALPMLTRPAPASTVSWMVNLSGGIPESSPTAWWRFEAELISSSSGFSDTEGRLWSPDGRLVATSRQLVAEFSGG
jgi:acyl-CoA thioesterase